jgi:steroid delta-isomerase-like uncharacterized protein
MRRASFSGRRHETTDATNGCTRAPTQRKGDPVNIDENKSVVRRYVDDLFNAGDLSVVDDIVDENIAYREAGRSIDGREAFKEGLSGYLGSFRNPHLTIDDLVESDRVAFQWTMRGTSAGPLMGVDATGKAVGFSGIVFVRLVGGKIVEWWGNWDALGLMQQLGAATASRSK